MEDEINPWEYVSYVETSIASDETRIGGVPSYVVSSEEFEWPLCLNVAKNLLVPLKFLGQIKLKSGHFAFLFLGESVSDEIVRFFEYENEQTAVLNSETGAWPKWVTPKKYTVLDESWLWSPDKAVTPSSALPLEPYWIHGYDETPENYPHFLFQIPEDPGGLRKINTDMQTYVFFNDAKEIVLFNEIY